MDFFSTFEDTYDLDWAGGNWGNTGEVEPQGKQAGGGPSVATPDPRSASPLVPTQLTFTETKSGNSPGASGTTPVADPKVQAWIDSLPGGDLSIQEKRAQTMFVQELLPGSQTPLKPIPTLSISNSVSPGIAPGATDPAWTKYNPENIGRDEASLIFETKEERRARNVSLFGVDVIPSQNHTKVENPKSKGKGKKGRRRFEDDDYFATDDYPVFEWEEQDAYQIVRTGPKPEAIQVYSHSHTRIPGKEGLLMDTGAWENL